jgi:hypothetical protein
MKIVKRSLKHRNNMLFVVVLIGLVLTGPISAVAAPLPIDEYWQQVEETQALVKSLWTASPETRHIKLESAAKQWEAITAVALPDGSVVPVHHSRLVTKMRANPPDLDELDEMLTSLLKSRDSWPQREATLADTEALNRILARAEFQWPTKQPSPLEEWWQELRRQLFEFLVNLIPEEIAATLSPLCLNYALPGLGALALILVLTYAMRGLLADFVAEREADENGGQDQDMTSAAALKRAQTLSARGDYRTAVRYLYLSTLLLLEERGLLRYDRSLTNHEYLRSIAHKPEMAAIFRDVVDIFDRVWYGFRPLDERAYNWYADRVKELQQQQ